MIEETLGKRFLWCDAEANCHRMSTLDGVRDIVRKASSASFDALIVDVKPLSGETLYNSRFAPKLGEVDGKVFPDSFDLLSAFIDEAKSDGIQIYAAVNIFSEGHRQWMRGPGYEHRDWQVTMYETTRIVTIGAASETIEFIDPWDTVDSTAIYTRRSGTEISAQPGKLLLVVEGDRVISASPNQEGRVQIPIMGCVLSIPLDSPLCNVNVGYNVVWGSEPAFRLASDSRTPSWGIFVDPIGPARKHELDIIEEIASRYGVHGIVFDRMRYPNLYADFSPSSREEFEHWLGKGSICWPDDVFRISDRPWETPVHGKYYKQWLEWRAWQIHDFAAEAVDTARAANPEIDVGIYTGSWYESYYDVGVNWGSKNQHLGYSWMTPDYNQTGIAEMFDFICTGCYYPYPTKVDARAAGKPEGATVEAACDLSRTAIAGATPFYSSLYVRDYNDKPEVFEKAINTSLCCSEGIMIFDLVYLEEYKWWEIPNRVFHGK